jgi:hypothetical protein
MGGLGLWAPAGSRAEPLAFLTLNLSAY